VTFLGTLVPFCRLKIKVSTTSENGTQLRHAHRHLLPPSDRMSRLRIAQDRRINASRRAFYSRHVRMSVEATRTRLTLLTTSPANATRLAYLTGREVNSRFAVMRRKLQPYRYLQARPYCDALAIFLICPSLESVEPFLSRRLHLDSGRSSGYRTTVDHSFAAPPTGPSRSRWMPPLLRTVLALFSI
jgi:hypothetical protein